MNIKNGDPSLDWDRAGCTAYFFGGMWFLELKTFI